MRNKFPQRLRQLRKEKGITQEALGQYLHYNHTAVANYESGRNQPSFDDLLKLADYFDVSTDFLLGRSEKFYPPADKLWEKLTVAEFLHLLQQAESYPKMCRSFFGKRRKENLTERLFSCKIRITVCTLSSGDRAFGSGPKGRRFESCRVQREVLS